MKKISYSRHRFPAAVIYRAVWLYFRFPLSFRDVEGMLAERGIDASYETIRLWVLKFGPAIAANIRSRRVRPSGTWYLDEVFVRIGGKRTYLWRAVDDEGEVLEVLAQSHRNKRAALKLMRNLLKKQGFVPDEIVTDKLGFYAAALRDLGLAHIHVTGGLLNNRAEVSHQPTRTPNGPVQVARINATFSIRPRRHLQSIQCATPLGLSPNSSSNVSLSIR